MNIVRWGNQFLLEQKRTLEIIFYLHYTLVTCDPARTLEIVKCIICDIDFARKQVNAPFFDSEALSLWKSVSHLALIICVEVLNIEAMEEIGSQGEPVDLEINGAELVSHPKILWEITQMLEDTLPKVTKNEPCVFAPLLMAWSCYLQRLSLLLDGNCTMEFQRLYDLISGESVRGLLLSIFMF